MDIQEVYSRLFGKYGPQGWWPLVSQAGRRGRDEKGYYPGFYGPLTSDAIFEVGVGAVLTQNTAWKNAEQAVAELLRDGYGKPETLLGAPLEDIAHCIRSAGYYNVKAKKLKALSSFFASLKKTSRGYSAPDRVSLLDVWGVGPETADSILLYGFGKRTFVVDAYTRRILNRLGLLEDRLTYEEIRRKLETSIEPNPNVYMEYHALLVNHAKLVCRTRPLCGNCFLADRCAFHKNIHS